MMTPRFSFRPGARAEIRAARRWYEDEVRRLGRAFIAELDATLAFAALHPEMYPAADDAQPAIRRALLHRFPYALVDEIHESGALVVLSCFHMRRDEPGWRAPER